MNVDTAEFATQERERLQSESEREVEVLFVRGEGTIL